MKILISAAETSSDIHGAQLLRALREQLEASKPPESLEAFGIGGPKLREAGLRVVVDSRELLSMGFTEVLGRLPVIFRALRKMAAEARKERPDVVVLLDYPDFHFRLAHRIAPLGIPLVYYIPPKVWAWRGGRIKTLKKRFSRILSILPFEVEFYKRHGIDVAYVGNPLVDELPLGMTREEARVLLGLSPQALCLVIMPGSRPAELTHHLELMLEASLETGKLLREVRLSGSSPLTVLLPFPGTADLGPYQAQVRDWLEKKGPLTNSLLTIRISQADAAICLVAADAGLIKSGTSTLEAALLGCPHAILYRSSLLSHLIFDHLVRRNYPGPIGLVNLIHGWKAGEPWLVREFVEKNVEPGALARELVRLLVTGNPRDQMVNGLRLVRDRVVGTPRSPSQAAASEVLQVARGRRVSRAGKAE